MTDAPDRGRGVEWENFTGVVEEVSGIPSSEIRRESRLVEDLNLDSLELAQVLVALLVDYQLEGLPDRLQQTDWKRVTVGELFDACLAARPSGTQLEWR